MNKTALHDEKTTRITKTFEREIEKLESKVAAVVAGIWRNHNETLVPDSDAEIVLDLEIEEMEAIVAPGVGRGLPNHNETLLRDTN